MMTTEVTQGQWQAVMDNNPSHFKNCGSNCPVENVSWSDVQEFIKRLNQREVGNRYRLPTEAEWEFAARAGSTTRYCFGDDESRLAEYAWFGTNSGLRTQPVGGKKPNAWGLYDMHGNVWEWCQDWYGDYPSGSVSDPQGPSSGSDRVVRGCSWQMQPMHCRSAFRDWFWAGGWIDQLGFRLAADWQRLNEATAAVPGVQDPGFLRLNTHDINSRFIENANVGRLFVISGMVKNGYPENRGGITVSGEIFATGRRPVHQETVYCGNVMSDLELADLDWDTILARLANHLGDNRSNVKIEPGESIPFMVVFADLPDDLDEFTIEVASSYRSK